MSNFGKAKKYYTNAEVEKKIKTLLSAHELKIAAQNDALMGLKVKTEKQEKEIKELVKREKLIKNALINATETAKAEFDAAKTKRDEETNRLEQFLFALETLKDAKKPVSSKQIEELKEIISDFKSGAGMGELARRRELENARQKLEKANQQNKEAQKSIEERYKLVLQKYEHYKSASASDANGFSIDEALNPTASLEEIMKDIFSK